MQTSSLDPVAILAALGVSDATAVAPVGGGTDTAIWRVECGLGTCALRVFRAEQAATWAREVVAMDAARAAIPVPRVHARGQWRDRPALLLAWCPGRPLLHALRARPWTAWRWGLRFGQLQARLHQVPAPDALRQHGSDWIDLVGPGETALRDHMTALAPRSDALLHLDYHPLNVMADGGELSAVLDWANARAGDPRADVARTRTLLRLAPEPDGVPRLPSLLVRRTLEAGWRRGYQSIAGPLDDLAPFNAWAGAMMLRDLAPKIGRPGSWLQSHHLEPIRHWTDHWKRQAGIGEQRRTALG